jgi:raffinose synthase
VRLMAPLVFCLLAPAAAQAATVVKPSWFPGDLDVTVDGQTLLERLSIDLRPSGADQSLRCEPQALASTEGPFGCRAGGVAARVWAREMEPGVVALRMELDRDTPLAAEDGLRVTAGVAGFEAATVLVRSEPWWMRPVFVRQQNFVPDETQLVLVKRARDYVALLPLAAGGAIGWARGANLSVASGGITVALQARAPWSLRSGPVLVAAVHASPYEAVAAAYRQGLAAMGNPGRLRTEKAYPDVFNRLGFCTWNTLYEEQTTEKLLGVAKVLKGGGVPLGFFIIDAGWQSSDGKMVFFQKLRSFEPDAKKIPGGLKQLVADLRVASGARSIGVWHALQGVPGGVDPESPLAAQQKEHLWSGAGGALVPDPTSDKGAGFYRDFYVGLQAAGVDLVKVDFQNWLESAIAGRVPVFQGLQQSQYNLQAAVKPVFGDNLIDCMSMGNNVLFTLREGNVVRSSLDYLLPEGPLGHRRHVLNNMFNSLAVQQVAWPDFDMWEAYGDFAVFHSVLRALSGGPVYFTGDPARQDWALLRRLVLADGSVLRTDAPVVPTRDALFVDPSTTPVPLKGFARVGAAGLLGAFNVNEAGAAVNGLARVSDVEGLQGARFAVQEYFSREVAVVGPWDPLPIALGPNQAALFRVVPVAQGAAVFGLLDKYVSPRTVLAQSDDGATLRVRVAEGGTLGVWLEKPAKSLEVDGVAVTPVPAAPNGLLNVALPETPARAHEVEITR